MKEECEMIRGSKNKIKRFITILCTISMTFFGVGSFAYAQPTDPFADYMADNVEIVVADSAQQAAEAVPAENNEKFYKVDMTNGDVKTGNDETVKDGFEKLYGESYAESGLEDSSKDKQKQQIEQMTSESEMYSLNQIEGNTAEITSQFATCRLLVKTTNISNTYGALSGTQISGFCILKYADEKTTAEAYKALCKEFGTENVLKDMPIKGQDDLNESGLKGSETGTNWSYDYMEFKKAADPLELRGNDVVVAVLDTGIMKSHKAFEGTYIKDGYNFVDVNTDVSDKNGHGTVSSSVIAQSTGMNVSILPVKVLDDNGDGSEVDLILGLNYAEEKGAIIANVSLGGSLDDEDLAAMETAFDGYSGIIIAAAGNSGYDVRNNNFWPAISDRVISVSALKNTGNNTAAFDASYSNFGECIDYTAPGTGIYGATLDNTYTYKYYKGTSFASPHVAAAAALIMSNDKTIDTQSEMVAALNKISKDEGDAGFDIYCGNGCPILGNLTIKEPAPTETQPTTSATVVTKPKVVVVNISNAKAYAASMTYTGKALKPLPSVSYGGKTLKNGTDYTVSYKNNKKVGKATVTITGKGNYKGTKSISFKVNPKGTSLKKISRSKKALTVKWKKQKTKMSTSRITGYHIQLATNSKFTANVKNVYVKSYSKKSKKIKKLKKKKKYYVRVRTYKTISGTKYYSNWSKVKSAKTK